MANVTLIYSDKYDLGWGRHVFPTEKYRLIKERLLAEGLFAAEDIVPARAATEEEVLLVHTPRYYNRLWAMTEQPERGWMEFEAPITRQVMEAALHAAGGSIIACEKALESGETAISLGGGFHHAFPDHGEGFCFIHDVAVAIRVMLGRGAIKRCVVIDCDLHQGNGTAFIFQDQPEVFTFSIHQEHLYPVKQRSDLDIGLDNGAGDEVYLAHLAETIPDILDSHRPDLAFYLAGADPYEKDQLGDLRLTMEGFIRRDEIIFAECLRRGIPVAAALAGGYASDTTDVVKIHVSMVKAALSA